MKTKTLIAFTLKAILILTFTIVGFSGFTKCGAESIVGKWKEVSGKDFCTAKGVKVTGKQFLPQDPKMGGQVIEIRADHTFTSLELMTWVPSAVKLTGTWTLSGDQLNTKLALNQSGKLYSLNSVIAWPFYSIWIELNSAFLDIWLKELSLFST